MKNRFNLNKEEKNHIRGLHNINEQVVGYSEQGLDEDAGMDTPGGNPDYFYGDGSLDKLRKFAEEQDSEMSKEEIIKNLLQIKGLIVDESPQMAIKRISLLLGELMGTDES
jgi:hypothetical protein|tara:strand:- start:12 stop:344 length:333 start_codon:yes stop_codon:yes gene_type:complete